MKNSNIAILTEAGHTVGMGHFVRCSSLYARLEELGYSPKFYINSEDNVAFEKYRYELMDYSEIPNEIANKMCIVDSYLASDKVINEIVSISSKCLFIDDNNMRQYTKGIVVNPNLYAKTLDYKRHDDVRYLLGEKYVILRKEFRTKPNKVCKPNISNIAVMIGGTDANNYTIKIVEEITQGFMYPVNLHIVVNHMLHSQIYNNFSRNKNNIDIRLYSNLSATEMVNIMMISDVFIAAGGQTVNELIQLNVPSILIEVAENQRNNINYAVNNNLALRIEAEDIHNALLSMLNHYTYDYRSKMIQNTKRFDLSSGVDNILKEFIE